MYKVPIFDRVYNLHVTQHFHPEITIPSVAEMADKYGNQPGETVYIVDCRSVQIEPISGNFREMVGMEASDIRNFTQLYEITDPASKDHLLNYTHNLISMIMNQNVAPEINSDIFRCIYRTIDGRYILKTTAVLARDKNGCTYYTLGKLQDITGFAGGFIFRYRFTGPGRKQVYANFNELVEFEPMLSERELQILNWVGRGYSSERIAEILFISRHTVDTHRRNILKKLEAGGSVDAYAKARDMGLL